MTSHLKAVIFDMDGLLIDSEPLWSEARTKILGEFGKVYSKKDKKLVMGRRYSWVVNLIVRTYKLPISNTEFATKEQAYLDALFVEKLTFMPGAKVIVDNVRQAGLKTAVATSSPRVRLVSASKKLKLKDFDAKVTGDEIVEGKPNPEIFLTTAKKLEVAPKSCVVLEDSKYGIRAANAAGMKSVCVMDSRFSQSSDFEGQYKPDLFVNSLKALSVDKLKKLFK